MFSTLIYRSGVLFVSILSGFQPRNDGADEHQGTYVVETLVVPAMTPTVGSSRVISLRVDDIDAIAPPLSFRRDSIDTGECFSGPDGTILGRDSQSDEAVFLFFSVDGPRDWFSNEIFSDILGATMARTATCRARLREGRRLRCGRCGAVCRASAPCASTTSPAKSSSSTRSAFRAKPGEFASEFENQSHSGHSPGKQMNKPYPSIRIESQ